MIPTAAAFARHKPVPDLASVDVGQSGGNTCAAEGPWLVTPTWVVSPPDDEDYHINIDVATNAAGDNWAGLTTGEAPSAGAYQENTGLEGNTGGTEGPNTNYRKYRVHLYRTAGSVLIETLETTQVQITFFTDPCA